MRFEWDEAKRLSNLAKHGLDFVDVQPAWPTFVDPRYDDRRDYGEDRWVATGLLNGHWVVVLAYTEPVADVIRVLSLRRATTNERRTYEKALRDRLGEA